MKKMIMIASLLSLLTIALPVCAEEAQQPAGQPAPEAAQMNPEKMDAEVQKMQEMRNKLATEKDPAIRKELMHQHMRMMQDGMQMMDMMGGQGMMQGEKPGMMEKQDPAGMPMADRMAMMEKKMAMMENMMGGGMMMGQKGMMGGQGMMGGGMMAMREKKMKMMQEIMKGLMTQQEMMMK
ncbi:MAG: hypothetical protein HY885_10465 [Deltaproteobacteria bacterium]|nr:hypothetical protein [Deltaproteobacteria bacterium]